MNSDMHAFSVCTANLVGVNAAVILDHIYFWCQKNEANERHYHDGLYWTYNSIKALKDLFPYMSEKAIRGALKKLEDAGYIVSGNFNGTSYDRTKWYAITDSGKAVQHGVCPKGQMHLPERANGNAQKGNSDISTYIYLPSTTNDICAERPKGQMGKKSFVPPTVDEVQAYINEKGYHFSAQEFVDYYEADDWHLSNGKPVRAWKRCCTTWEKHWKESSQEKGDGRDWDQYNQYF